MKSVPVRSNRKSINSEHELSIFCILYYDYLYVRYEKT